MQYIVCYTVSVASIANVHSLDRLIKIMYRGKIWQGLNLAKQPLEEIGDF